MNPAQILAGIPKLSALVIGDICLDRWCTYDPDLSEASRETGIPRVGVVAAETTPGAGGTVANNLMALGVSRVAVLGVVGDDGNGMELLRGLEARDIASELVVKTAALPTFTYTKLLNATTGEEDLPRVDFVNTRPMPDEVERKLLNRLESAVGAYDVILVEDQAETVEGGVITPAVRRALGELAGRHRRKVFWVDSRKRIEHFRKVVAKPNQDEAAEACMRLFGSVDLQRLRQHMEASLLIVTQGARGAILVDPERETLVETQPVENPVGICGAGDSFSAGASLALAVTGSPADAVRFGNLIASITIMKKGTGTASPDEVLAAGRLG
jgi:rfaE bifunctional protein kinase chain/domain